jgi:hypothetical protein
MSDSLPCPGDQIVCDGQIEPVSCLEVRMSSQRHHIILAQSLAEPVCDGCLADIMECTLINTFDSIFLNYREKLLKLF